jgi:DNA repair protein RadC
MEQQLIKWPITEYKTTLIYRLSMVSDRRVKYKTDTVSHAQNGANLIRETIKQAGNQDREQVVVILLNSKNKVIGTHIAFMGGLCSCDCHVREILKIALISNAISIVTGHNHPSGDILPSPEDKAINKRLIQAAGIMGINLYDNIIISTEHSNYFSMNEQGAMGKE